MKYNSNIVRLDLNQMALLGLTIAYLLLYTASSIRHSSSHITTHGVHCNEEAEKDPCHRIIYHGDHSRSCKHAGHVTKPEQDCRLCQWILADIEQIVFVDWNNQQQDGEYYTYRRYVQSIVIACSEQIQNRGPPLIIA